MNADLLPGVTAFKRRPISERLGDPTVSVIVTSYNYGHFLANCLDSVLDQTFPPDELIVVDDGSTDATPAIIESYAGRIRTIRTANNGQAAAFNTGFAASQGELVLFLDADDMLAPEAIESVLNHWSDDLAVLTFGLETIDENGRSIGVHRASVTAESGDNRPRLLRTGTFRFPPTSGNVFSRTTLEHALPMPEARWRVSADCYLIRAAALHGRAAHVPHILGRYRLHRANNYARGFALEGDVGLTATNQADVADALDDLSRADALLSDDPADRERLRELLRNRARALRESASPCDFTDRTIEKAAPTILQTNKVLRALSSRLYGQSAFTVQDRDQKKPSFNSVQAETQSDLLFTRYPPVFEFDRLYEFEVAGPHQDCMVIRNIDEGTCADLRLLIGPTPSAVMICLAVRSTAPHGETGEMKVLVDGQDIARVMPGDKEIAFSVARNPWSLTRVIRIEVRGSDQMVPRIASVMVKGEAQCGGAPLLPMGRLSPAGPLLAGTIGKFAPDNSWDLTPTDDLRLVEEEGILDLTAPQSGLALLVLVFADPLPAGNLAIHQAGTNVFTGQTGDASTLRVPIRMSLDYPIRLNFSFHPLEAGMTLCIAGIGLKQISELSDLDNGRGRAWLNVGETVGFGETERADNFLGQGWAEPDHETARNLAPEADLHFQVSPGGHDLCLHVGLAPLFSPPSGYVQIIGMSIDGEMKSAVCIDGEGECDIAIGTSPKNGFVDLTLHSGFALASGAEHEAADGVEAPQSPDLNHVQTFDLRMAPLAIRSLRLTGRDTFHHDIPFSTATHPPFHTTLETVRKLLLARNRETHMEALAKLRHTLAETIVTCDASLCVLLAANEARLSIILDLGAAMAHHPTHSTESLCVTAAKPASNQDQLAALRQALICILYVPAYASGIIGQLDQIPAPLLSSPTALARYLGRAPVITTPGEHKEYAAYLEQLLGEIHRALSGDGQNAFLCDFASEVLGNLRSSSVIFGKGTLRKLIRLRSRCIERRLSNAGSRLALAHAARSWSTRLRIGVLVRDVLPNPEGWALLGMYGGIDRDCFDPVLIRMDRGDVSLSTDGTFCNETCLSGKSIETSVAEIRDLHLDIFVMGCYVADWEKTSAIAAHRLASLQIWHGAVCPTTGGFRSFDLAMSCRATEPPRPQRHYTEDMAWINGPLQCAYAFSAPPDASCSDVRRDLGIDPDAMMLSCGALTHKIGNPLLNCWSEIMAALPDAVLVLYPFAPNWSMAHDRAALEARLLAAGLPANRTVLLSTLTPDRVRQVLKASDVYLDSFPYTGATTVCEALSVGTPAVTCAGDALRQLTGASWIKAYGLDELVAASPTEYVNTVVGLSGPKLDGLKQRLAIALQRPSPPHFDTKAFGKAYSDALWLAARNSRHFPGLGHDAPIVPQTTIAKAPMVRRPLPVKLAILASPRTGSTLLCNMLNRTPGVTCHYELFHADMIQFKTHNIKDPREIVTRDNDPDKFLGEIFGQAKLAGDSLVGFKHFGHLSSQVTRAVIDDPDIRIVHLTRANILAQYSSEKIAASRDEWSSKTGSARSFDRIPFEQRDFETFEKYQRSVEDDRSAQLAAAGRSALSIEFTEVAESRAAVRLSEFVGLHLASDPEPTIQRQNRAVILDRFSNPDALERYMDERGLSDWLWSG